MVQTLHLATKPAGKMGMTVDMASATAGPEPPQPVTRFHPMHQARLGKSVQPPVNTDPVESRPLQPVQDLRRSQRMPRFQKHAKHRHPPRGAF